MRYTLTDYQGNQIYVTGDQAKTIADEAGLLEITTNGQVHYINKSDIANLRPTPATESEVNDKLLDRPDFRGRPSPAKEIIRQKYGKPKSP